MAYGQYNLGGFGDQLSAEELQRAYALASQGQAMPPQQVPQQPPPDMSVSRGTGGPAQRIAQYNRADLADQNQAIALAGRQGEEESAGAEERSRLRMQQAEQQKGYNEQARADGAKDRARGDKKREDADKLLEEYKKNLTPPSATAGERVLQVVAALIAMGGKNAGAAAGASMLSKLAGSGRQERWNAEQAGRTQLYEMVTKGIDTENATEGQRHEIARRMGVADALYWDNVIEAQKEKGMGAAQRREADGLQLTLRMKARDLLRGQAVTEQKTNAAATKTRRENYFHSIPLEELRAMPDKVLGKDGHAVLASRIKDNQNDRGGYAKIAIDEGKARGEAGPEVGSMVPGGRRVRDPGVYGLLEKPTITKYVDGETKASSALRNIEELQQLVADNGTETWPTKAKQRMQFLEKQIKLDLKDAGELGTWDKGSAEVLGDMIGDPTAWNMGLGEAVEGVGTKLEEAKNFIKYKTELRAKSLGLEYDRGAIGEVPKAEDDPRVRKGFVAPNAADRGVQRAGPRAPFALPQSNLNLDEIAAAQRRVQALDEGVPVAWMK